jgi:Na+(H+)/acetate symporter ActP
MNFATIDWVIVVVYLAASMLIGLLGRKYVGNTAHFLVAGRELGTYIGIATLAATEIGTITFMYNSELGYRYGFAAFSAALISGIAMIFVGRTGFVIRRLRELRLMTVPEYFEVKYSRGLRIVTGFLVALGGILNMGVFLKIEGEFLTVISGLNQKYLVATMIAILLLELIYTTVGGMISIVITDYLQYVLLSIATIIITICGMACDGCEGDERDGFERLQSHHRAEVWVQFSHLAAAAVVVYSHLLADDGDADVFDQGPGGFKACDDVDRVYFSGSWHAAYALGDRCAYAARTWCVAGWDSAACCAWADACPD